MDSRTLMESVCSARTLFHPARLDPPPAGESRSDNPVTRYHRYPYENSLISCDLQAIVRAVKVVTMTKTPIEIDEEALAIAAEVLGTRTKKDTVNAALREVGQRLVRLRALAGLGEMADRGDFDEFLGNKVAYRK